MVRAAAGRCCLTLRAVSEFFAMVTRNGMMGRTETAPVAQAMIDLFTMAAASADAVRAALRLAAAGRVSPAPRS